MTQITARILAVCSMSIVCTFVLFSNTYPFDVATTYDLGSKELPALAPSNRIQKYGDTSRIIGDSIYATGNMKFAYSDATVKLRIRNSYMGQEVRLGYRDQQSWHYYQHKISAPFIDQLNWPHVGNGPYLFQKALVYRSTADFLSSPPTDKLIGVYDYDASVLKQPSITIQSYSPATTDTTINTPLRGKTTMYMYLSGEPFKLGITKRDLNWYADPDVSNITVYKGTSKVYQSTLDDDGNTSGNRKTGSPQAVNIQNPGPGLPEAGVYKVVIDQPADSVITKIQTNLHKIAFEGPIYPVNNHEIYGDIAPITMLTSVHTNAQNLTAETDHSVKQNIDVGGKPVPVTAPLQKVSLNTVTTLSNIGIPKSDVILNGAGYFSFTPDQFFAPSPYHIVPITSAEDLARVDYVLTGYRTPKQLGDGWVEVERDFDLSDAVVQKGKLSWVISAPGLADNKRTIEIKDIQMTLTKKGWFER